jgi:hypothetical protein
MEVPEEVVIMPSGWMPDARHDLRMRPVWVELAQQDKRRRAFRAVQPWGLHHKSHRTARPMRGAHA